MWTLLQQQNRNSSIASAMVCFSIVEPGLAYFTEDVIVVFLDVHVSSPTIDSAAYSWTYEIELCRLGCDYLVFSINCNIVYCGDSIHSHHLLPSMLIASTSITCTKLLFVKGPFACHCFVFLTSPHDN